MSRWSNGTKEDEDVFPSVAARVDKIMVRTVLEKKLLQKSDFCNPIVL